MAPDSSHLVLHGGPWNDRKIPSAASACPACADNDDNRAVQFPSRVSQPSGFRAATPAGTSQRRPCWHDGRAKCTGEIDSWMRRPWLKARTRPLSNGMMNCGSGQSGPIALLDAGTEQARSTSTARWTAPTSISGTADATWPADPPRERALAASACRACGMMRSIGVAPASRRDVVAQLPRSSPGRGQARTAVRFHRPMDQRDHGAAPTTVVCTRR